MKSKKIHPFRKKWGQNFLRDPNTIAKIIHSLQPDKADTILEIGPGDGALTDELSKRTGHIHAVEIDPLLIKYLEEKKYPNVTIHQADILKWDLTQLPDGIKIIGIFTDGDLRRCLNQEKDLLQTLIGNVMTTNFKSIANDSLAIDAAEIMEKHKIFTLVVTQTKENVSGIITMHQLLESGVI